MEFSCVRSESVSALAVRAVRVISLQAWAEGAERLPQLPTESLSTKFQEGLFFRVPGAACMRFLSLHSAHIHTQMH
jgi:hypothetical protein